MCKRAYDECYLDSMMLKTRYLFRLIARNCSDVFGTITEYMNSEYRKHMDTGNPLYLNKTPKQILGSIGITIDLAEGISRDYDEFILEWIADIYTYLQWKYNISSSEIISKIKAEELYEKYFPLHEASIENGVEKLRRMYL